MDSPEAKLVIKLFASIFFIDVLLTFLKPQLLFLGFVCDIELEVDQSMRIRTGPIETTQLVVSRLGLCGGSFISFNFVPFVELISVI